MTTQSFIRLAAVLIWVWAIVATTASPVHAQTNKSEQQSTEVNLIERANWNAFLTSSEQAVARDGIDKTAFERISRDANQVESNARQFIEQQTPLLDQIKVQLDELGPAPKEDEQQEAPEISRQRTDLTERFAQIDGEVKDARLAIVRAQQLRASIVQKRRDRFVRSISTRVEGVYSVPFLERFVGGFEGLGRSFTLMIRDSYSVFQSRLSQRPQSLILVLIAFLIIGLAYRFLRRQATHLSNLAVGAGMEAEPEKSIRAAVVFFNNGLLNAITIYLVFYVLNAFDLFTLKLERFSWLIVLAGVMLVMGRSLGNIFLSPNRPAERIAELSNEAANKTNSIVRNALLVVVVLYILNDTAVMLVSPFEVSIGLSVLLTLVVVIATFRSLLSVSRDRITQNPMTQARSSVISWVYVKVLLWLASILAGATLLLGYVAFAEYLSLQIIAGIILIGILWLALRLIDALKQTLLSNETNTLRLSQSVGIQPTHIKQFSVLGFGVIKTVVMLAVALAMLLPWGFRTSEWVDWVNEAFFGFQVGGLTISISAILMVIALFLIGYAITRGVQNWLSGQFLPTTQIDTGLRNSISTVLGYVGIVIAAILAVSAAGIDLSNLAIVAGALSVGVGFGLQSIVNNFVSGLILLAERPIKSGDWIITSGGEGTVRKISVRSTEIETFDRATIIVPNSTLITESVTNWTHTSKFGRVNIVVGVGYDSDPEQVKQILLDCFNDHDGILKNPAPSAFFTDFGADALTFDVRGFLSNIENGFGVKSDLRFAIFAALDEAGINIPYPQRDVHLKADWQEVGKALSAPKPSGTRRRSTTKTKS